MLDHDWAHMLPGKSRRKMEGEEQRQPVTPRFSGWATLSVARLHSHQSLHRLHKGKARTRSWHDL